MREHEITPMYLSLRLAGESRSVSQATLHRWIESGLRVVRVGGRTLIDPADLREFVESRKEPSPNQNDDGPIAAEPPVKEIAFDGRDRDEE